MLARLPMTPLMLLPRVVNTPTTASAINAAATAYSESSRPVSSRRKFLIMFLLLRFGLRVKHCALTHHASSSLAEGPTLRELVARTDSGRASQISVVFGFDITPLRSFGAARKNEIPVANPHCDAS